MHQSKQPLAKNTAPIPRNNDSALPPKVIQSGRRLRMWERMVKNIFLISLTIIHFGSIIVRDVFDAVHKGTR